MNFKTKFLFLFVSVFLMINALPVFAQHSVRASIDDNRYEIGDIIRLQIEIEENSGFFGLYFDLIYDETILSLERISECNFTDGYPSTGSVHYAIAEAAAGAYGNEFVVASYSLDQRYVETMSLGGVMELDFRVIGNNGVPNTIQFGNGGVIDGAGNEIPGVQWYNSREFALEAGTIPAYINIIEPHNNKVVDKEDGRTIPEDAEYDYVVDVSLTCTEGSYTVRLYNQAIPEINPVITSVTEGFLLDRTVPLLYEDNTIVAELLDSASRVIAINSIYVYLAPDAQYIKIDSPIDHSLHITDMVEVEIISSVGLVEVNEMPATYISDHKYKANVWLKKGFNTIEAIARVEDGENVLQYKDKISVYYQKNDALFRFLTPKSGQGFKPSDENVFYVSGEIGSKYRSIGDITDENNVTVEINFDPFNPFFDENNWTLSTTISEVDIAVSEDDERQSRYFFRTENFSLEGLTNGTLTITAHKNRDPLGYSSEAVISTIAYVDNNRLSIDLIQPMVFAEDILDSREAVNSFNLDPETGDGRTFEEYMLYLDFDNNGAIGLGTSLLEMNTQDGTLKDGTATYGIDSVADVEEARDGTMYLLTNTKGGLNHRMTLYKKELGEEVWKEVKTWYDAVGYDLCYTDMGLLIGATHLYVNDLPVMYILEEGEIYNMQLPVDLLYVQFIRSINNKVYFYGNDYLSVYSFDENTIRRSVEDPDNTRVVLAGDLDSIPFPNNVSIKQFILTDDEQTAVLRTNQDQVLFYNRGDSGYVMKEGFLREDPTKKWTHVAGGSYSNSNFSAFLILNDNPDTAAFETAATVVMKNNRTREYTIIEDLDLSAIVEDTLDYLWVSFDDDRFSFLYDGEYTGGSYTGYMLRKGQIFFDRFNLGDRKTIDKKPGTIDNYNHELFTAKYESAYINYGLLNDGLNIDMHIWEMKPVYSNDITSNPHGLSNPTFNYVNPDIEGIMGFSFEVSPAWIDDFTTSPIEIGFEVHIEDREDVPKLGIRPLNEFIKYDSSDDDFKILYNDVPDSNRKSIFVEFQTLQKNCHLTFDVIINPHGTLSPKINNFSIIKKIPLVIARNGEAELELPVRGRVNDRTVSEIMIYNDMIPLERDGSFYSKIKLVDKDLDEDNVTEVKLSCQNSINETATMSFTVEIVDSFCKVGEVAATYTTTSETTTSLPDDAPDDTAIVVNDSNLSLVGKYFGLHGVVGGYELRRLADNEEDERILERGIFENRDSTYSDDIINLLAEGLIITEPQNYTGYDFGPEIIRLYPGQQKLIVYVQNPNGSIHKLVGIFDYNLLPENEGIVIEPPLETQLITDIIPSPNEPEVTINLNTYEEKSDNGYIFNRLYDLKGYVQTNFIAEVVKARSMTPGLSFTGGAEVVDVDLELENRFSFPIHITMDETINKTFVVEITTGIPGVKELKKTVNIEAIKSFANTSFIPDFSPMIPPDLQLVEDTIDTMEIVFYMNRRDVPSPIDVTLFANFKDSVSGTLVKVDPLDESDYPLYTLKEIVHTDGYSCQGLPGLKPGNNRLSWKLEFDYGNDEVIMSSSWNEGMEDTLFVYDPDEKAETVIGFSRDLSTNFYGNDANGNNYPLPVLNIGRDVSTKMTILLNGSEVEDPWTGSNSLTLAYDLNDSDLLLEGKNELSITYHEFPYEDEAVTESYAFLYDSLAPVVRVEERKIEYEQKNIDGVDRDVVPEFSIFVKEANYKRAFLFQKGDILESTPHEITIFDRENLRLAWKDIVLNPGTHVPFTLAVRVEDITGKQTMSDAVSSEENQNASIALGSQPFELLFEDEDTVDDDPGGIFKGEPTGLDDGYLNSLFPTHAKFAPGLLGQRTPMNTITGNSSRLFGNTFRQQIYPPVIDYDIGFGERIASNGEFLVIGAPKYDSQGNVPDLPVGLNAYRGIVYIYKKNPNSEWVLSQTLENPVMNDGWYNFGSNVVMSDNRLVITAIAYTGTNLITFKTYSLDNGQWQLHSSAPVTSYPSGTRHSSIDAEGSQLAMSPDGNTMICGLGRYYHNSILDAGMACILQWNGSTWETKHNSYGSVTFGYTGAIVDISSKYLIYRKNILDDIVDRDYRIDTYQHNPSISEFDMGRELGSSSIDGYRKSMAISDEYLAYGSPYNDPDEAGSGIDRGSVVLRSNRDRNYVTIITQPKINGAYQSTLFGQKNKFSGDYLIVSGNPCWYIFKKNPNSGEYEFIQLINEAAGDSNRDVFYYPITVNEDQEELILGVRFFANTNNYVVSYKLNSNFFENTGSGFGGSQMLFQVDKDEVTDPESIPEKIRFVVTGQYYEENMTGLQTEKTVLETDEFSEVYIADDSYYYVVNMAPLDEAYQEAAKEMTGGDLSELTPGNIIDGNVFHNIDVTIETDIPIMNAYSGELPSDGEFSRTLIYNPVYQVGDESSEELNRHVEAKSPNALPTEARTILFWMHSEEEGAGKNREIYGKVEKSFFYYKDHAQNDDLIELRYRENDEYLDLLVYNEEQKVTEIQQVLVPGKDTWNLIALRITKDNLDIIVNGTLVDSIGHLPNSSFEDLLVGNERFFFGSKLSETDGFYSTGFYSIAEPYFVNTALKDRDIQRIYRARLNEAIILNNDRDYNFDSSTDQIDDLSPELLRTRGGGDYFNNDHNGSINTSSGSFKASSVQENYIQLIEDNSTLPKEWPCIAGSDAHDERDASCTIVPDSIGPDYLHITATNPERPGKYFFGDKTGNYGLRRNRYYSVSGSVSTLTARGTRIVLRINGQEQSMDLNSHEDFHFIYDNKDLLTPEDVCLYLEVPHAKLMDGTLVPGYLVIDTNIIFNEGNYILEEDVQETAASTTYSWGYEGYISLRYKPLNGNIYGTVNYETVLFDSEYIAIGTRIPEGETEAFFYTKIKTSDGEDKELLSTVKVLNRWQIIDLAYDWDKKKCHTYFYVDNKLVSSIESDSAWGLPNKGTIAGEKAEEDNVYFGSNLDRTIFAEGYLDEIRIRNLFAYPDIDREVHPVNIIYDPEDEDVSLSYGKFKTVNNLNGPNNSSSDYIIETLSGHEVGSGSFDGIPPIQVGTLAGGRYRFKTVFVNSGHSYNDYLYFNIDKAPAFALQKQTPFIANNDHPTDIGLKFLFDPYQHFEKEDIIYAGLVVGLFEDSAGSNDEPIITQYITQNFLTQEVAKWIRGTRAGTMTNIVWEDYEPDNNGYIHALFPDYVNTGVSKLILKYKPFYFSEEELTSTTDSFDYATLAPKEKTIIPVVELKAEKVRFDEEQEYKLNLEVLANSAIDFASLESDLTVSYYTKKIWKKTVDGVLVIDEEAPLVEKRGTIKINNGYGELYYDDIFPGFGQYECDLSLVYNGVILDTFFFGGDDDPHLDWTDTRGAVAETAISSEVLDLNISDLSLCYLDTETNEATIRLTCDYFVPESSINNINLTAYIIHNGKAHKDDSLSPITGIVHDQTISLSHIIDIVDIPKGNTTIKLVLELGGLEVFKELEINNDEKVPEILWTNKPDTYINYNNIYISWMGMVNNQYYEDIAYSYNFNEQGWSPASSQIRDIRFFDLDEGEYTFAVTASRDNVKSSPRVVPFTVDLNRPVFDDSKIERKIRYVNGIPVEVKLIGREAIEDINLQRILKVNGENINVTPDGSFETSYIPLNKDGDNEILITAYDLVNLSDHVVVIPNPMTEILYPDLSVNVRYSPFVLVGKIYDDVPSLMEIYVSDPMTKDREGDYTKWKKAVINEDRTFFVEDLFINPGTETMEITTELKMVCVIKGIKDNDTQEGTYTFERVIKLDANEILMPIELSFSTHAVEGQNADTEITIDCRANVDNISTWSIDFDGDGIYDVIDVVDSPLSVYAREHSWTHAYSTIGLVKPRVRVITTDGVFFSVTDTLIIHEKIKDASPTMINNPISLSSVTSRYNTQRLFIIRQEDQTHYLDIYTVPQFDPWPFKSEDSINLSRNLEMENPVRVRALDENTIFIADNRRNHAVIYQLTANEFGNYDNENKIEMTLNAEVKDLTIGDKALFISFVHTDYFVKVPIEDNKLITAMKEEIIPFGVEALENLGLLPVRENAAIEADSFGLLVADHENARVLRFSHDGEKALEKYSSAGLGEREFLEPYHVVSHQNRIFVFDNDRKDIQVFDSDFELVCTLKYNFDPTYANYVSGTFFDDVADIEIIAREENKRIYYYAMILSRSDNQMAVLRLPQWEEFRVRVQNNKLVFLKNGEVYTTKPTGADLKKILSSDSIPRVEGSLDYPALSPDGNSLIFTSRAYLYHGDPVLPDEEPYGYDYLYLYDIEKAELRILDLGYLSAYALERPTFSSNGDRIIFSAKGRGKNWQIFVYTIKTGDIRELDVSVGDTPENARFPYFSPDDRYVVFTTDYDGDEEIEIYDTRTAVRMEITDNNARDSYPVWNMVYPGEISATDENIESKISFISERDYHKAVYVVYLDHASDDNLQLHYIYGRNDNSTIEDTAVELSLEYTEGSDVPLEIEGNYPCFTGDGTQVFFETSDGYTLQPRKLDFTLDHNEQRIPQESHSGFVLEDVNILKGIRRMAGMKNTIANFRAENVDGNCIRLNWDRYTDHDIFYHVEYFRIGQASPDYKKVSTQDGVLLQGLEMNTEYMVRIFVKELGEIVTASQWRRVIMPVVAARPTITINEENPYLVELHGWKPDETHDWHYTWKIDNTNFPANQSRDFDYEFSTSGEKVISLIVADSKNDHEEISEPVIIDIKSDIRPVIDTILADDSSSIELSALNSLGRKINMAETRWVITGKGVQQEILRQGPIANVDLTGYSDKINVTLYLSRIPVNNQASTDVLVTTRQIDLDIKDVKPIITDEPDEDNPGLIYFSGDNSTGNIDWAGAVWTVYRDGEIIDQRNGVSSFIREFAETNTDAVYSITLTVPNRNDHLTVSTSKIVYLKSTPIEPAIEHQVLRLTENGNTVVAKLLLDCTKSVGNNIDFDKAQWNVAGAGAYGENPTQYGPTAVYTMSNIAGDAILPVVLTLQRRNSDNPVTITEFISISSEDLGDADLIIDQNLSQGSEGDILTLDVLKSTGPNINWEATEWSLHIPGQSEYTAPIVRKGPVVQLEINASAEESEVVYTCTLYRYGGRPETETGSFILDARRIQPIISSYKISGRYDNYYELSVLESEGINIDWDKTTWYIYDGHENVVQYRGAAISHAFIRKQDAMGYPVLVEMFHKGSGIPFTGYKTINIEGDELKPVIGYQRTPDKANSIDFNASSSRGNNIKWSHTVWTFGDGTAPQHGAVVNHTYPLSTTKITYRVSCTITRVNSLGQEEQKTVYKEINIAQDRIRPVVYAKVIDDTLILSAEESEGSGLMLDRSVWNFPGEGDSVSASLQASAGVSMSTSRQYSNNFEISTTTGPTGNTLTYGGSFGESTQIGFSAQSDYTSNNAFSSQNSHVGISCRRSISDNQTTQLVSLTVYRITEDGVQAETITVNINIEKARSGATFR